MDYQINFPHLGIYLDHVGKEFFIGNFSIAFYGIAIVLGMLLGIWAVRLRAKETGQSPDDYLDISLITLAAAIVGARLYYVIFSWDYYRLHPLEILDFRGGGLALYGSVIGAVSTAVIYALVKKLKPALMLDTACTGLVLGQVIGRWGNFFNREAFGTYTDNLLAMRLPLSAVRADEVTGLMMEKAEEIGGETFIQVHPTFLYESLWNLGVLMVLLLMTKNKFKKADGEIFLWYLLLYGIGRFWIEGLRTDQLLVWGTDIAVSQLLAAVLAVGSGLLILLIRFVFTGAGRRRKS